MTRWEHARIEKPMLNMDHGGESYITCAYWLCDQRGYDLHQVRINYGKRDTPHVVKHIFCTERHKQGFINFALHGNPNMPPGFRRSIVLRLAENILGMVIHYGYTHTSGCACGRYCPFTTPISSSSSSSSSTHAPSENRRNDGNEGKGGKTT